MEDGEGVGERLQQMRFELHSKVAMGSAYLIGFLQWKLFPRSFSTIPMFDMLYDARRPYRDVLTYVNQTASAVYAVCAAVAVAIGINGVGVLLE